MSRHVNWSDSTVGGSHRRNDSGVGPFSDTEDRSPKTSNDYGDPYSVPRLQEQLLKVTEQKERYKKKAEELDLDLMKVKLDLAQTKKDLGEREAQWRGVTERNEILDSDKQALLKQTKQQQDEITRLEAELRRAKRKSGSGSPPTSMSGAIPLEADDKTPRRTTSQRKVPGRRGSVSQKDYDRAVRHELRAEEERQEREREERLRRRMGNSPGDESDANNSKSSRGSKTSKGSHSSYIEPLGPKEPRPQVPHSPRETRPTAQYPTYATTQFTAPTYANIAPPASSKVTRSIRPQVFYEQGDDVYQQQQGSYNPYPLPSRSR